MMRSRPLIRKWRNVSQTHLKISQHQLEMNASAGGARGPGRQVVLSLYRQLVRASRDFKMSDPQWFLRRVRQEIYKDREPEERLKMFEVSTCDWLT